jgi:PadR family transcriptional regulator, regulatory protein PadR
MDTQYKDKLLKAWEEVYKKGQLTFWILLSLKENPKYMDEIKNFIEKESESTFTCEEQSLYRALRKLYDVEIVEYKMGEGNKGPQRKYYTLTNLGRELLQEFIKRNIAILYKDSIKNLLVRGGEMKHET